MKILAGLQARKPPNRIVVSLYLNEQARDNLTNITDKIGCSNPELFNHFSKLDTENLSTLINKRRRKSNQLNDNSNGSRFSINLKVETKSNLKVMANSLDLALSKLIAILLDLANREL